MSTPKILIIDDSAAICFFVTTALQRVGCQVSVALDGHNGLAKLSAQRPDCLILDIILPDINGYNICRRVRAVDPRHMLPIILTSTKNTPLDRSYGLRIGADRYLPKPFTEEELLQTVWDVLPPHVRSAITPLGSGSPAPTQDLENLIPRRCKDRSRFDINSSSSDYAYMGPTMRQIYAASDGRKTIKALIQATHLDEKEVMKALQRLFEQRRIEFLDQKGNLLPAPPFNQE